MGKTKETETAVQFEEDDQQFELTVNATEEQSLFCKENSESSADDESEEEPNASQDSMVSENNNATCHETARERGLQESA